MTTTTIEAAIAKLVTSGVAAAATKKWYVEGMIAEIGDIHITAETGIRHADTITIAEIAITVDSSASLQ